MQEEAMFPNLSNIGFDPVKELVWFPLDILRMG